MARPLESSAARRAMRREVWLRSRSFLFQILAFVGLVAVGMAWDWFPLSTTRYDDTRTLDGTLRLSLFIVAFVLALAVTRTTQGLESLVRRLPASPVALLQAQLQLAAAVGAMAFAGLLLTEYWTEPPIMHPSFWERLNPAEAETLDRLPGIPLLRFTVGDETHHGLASELSVAAMRAGRTGRTGVGDLSNYGYRRRWSHFPDDPPEPGSVLVSLAPADWSSMQPFQRYALDELGVPAGASVTVELERYVPRKEYQSQTWRRDGLGRERQWHALDRAVAFFGLLFLLTCAMSGPRASYVAALAPPFALVLSQWALFGNLPFRSWLLSSDLAGDRPRLPTLAPEQATSENLLFPAIVLVACVAAYGVKTAHLRSAPGAHQQEDERFVAYVRRHWRSGWAARVKLIAGALLFVAMIGSVSFHLAPNGPATRAVLWMVAAVTAIVVVAGLTRRWSRRDALLGRLPVRSRRLVNRRFALVWLGIVATALVPLAVEQTWPIAYGTDVEPILTSLRGSPTWMKSLVIAASGGLFAIFCLLGQGERSSRLGAAFCLFAVIMTLTTMSFRTPLWPLPVSLGVIALSLPFIHRLLKRRIDLGRAPELSELV